MNIASLTIAVMLVAATAVAILNAIITIPAYHFGVVKRFGKRTGRILTEGINLKWPFVEGVILVSKELDEIKVVAPFTTQDNLHLEVMGGLHFRPDENIKDSRGRNVFVAVSEEVFAVGIAKAIQERLGAIGGEKTGKEFISKRRAIGDLINCLLRLKTPPHLNHKPGKDEENCGVEKCGFPDTSTQSINPRRLLDFYTRHHVIVRKLLTEEHRRTAEHSSIERLYGIDVERFILADVNFSAETQAALEDQKQAELRGQAFREKLKLVGEAAKVGIDPRTAIHAVDITLEGPEKVTKRVIATEGNAQVIALDGLSIGKKR